MESNERPPCAALLAGLVNHSPGVRRVVVAGALRKQRRLRRSASQHALREVQGCHP